MGIVKGLGLLLLCLGTIGCQSAIDERPGLTADPSNTSIVRELGASTSAAATNNAQDIKAKSTDVVSNPKSTMTQQAGSKVLMQDIAEVSDMEASKQNPGVKVYPMVPERIGFLRSQEANTRINIRARPTTAASSPHYGLPGDEVTVLDYTARYQGHVWYFVRFGTSSAEGWVRDDLIEIIRPDVDELTDASRTDVDAPVELSETLQFSPGASETVINPRTVLQGTQHEYIFLANPGQQLVVELQAVDQNAVFQIYAEDTDYWMHLVGDYVGETATQWSGALPKSETGRYRIHVRSTWSDAVYSMTVAIK